MDSFDYEEIWKTRWGDVQDYGPFHRHLRRLMKKMIRPLQFQSVLDIGCGQGSFLAELQSEFPKIKPHGVDISSSALGLARQRVPHGDFRVLDISKQSLDKKCDLVVCSEVLEHISNDVVAIQNLRKMTNKYLLVSTPQGRMREFETEIGHVRNYSYGELTKKLEQNGFVILRVVQWGFPFYSPLYRDFLELTGARGTTGEFGTIRKVLSKAVYILFSLNSSNRGDELLVLAKPSA